MIWDFLSTKYVWIAVGIVVSALAKVTIRALWHSDRRELRLHSVLKTLIGKLEARVSLLDAEVVTLRADNVKLWEQLRSVQRFLAATEIELQKAQAAKLDAQAEFADEKARAEKLEAEVARLQAEVARLQAEEARLKALLIQHEIDPTPEIPDARQGASPVPEPGPNRQAALVPDSL